MQTQTIRLILPALHEAQATVKRERRRFNVLDCGRRFGKTTLGVDLVVEALLQGKPAAWFSPTYKMLAEVWRETRRTLAPLTSRVSEQEHRIELVKGLGVLDMWSLDNPDAARGRKYGRAVIDEAAMVRNLGEAWTGAIRPTLADLEGDAYFLSTPKGLNYFFELYQKADSDPDWSRWKRQTADNPYIKPSEIEAMRASLPERVFQQEILAEFISDGSYFQNIDNAAVIEAKDTPDQHTGHSIYGGLDWALSADFTVLTLACRECGRVVWWDRFNNLDFTYQRARVIEACQRWKVRGLLPERNSIGEPNIELLIEADIPILAGTDGKPGFLTTAQTKPALIQKLAAGLEHDNWQVPREFADELRAYEVETMASGHPKFSAPSGLHDDEVISLALTWWAITDFSWYVL